jgi:2'-5' RNA ligase
VETFFHEKRMWLGGPYPHFLVLLGEHPQFRAYARAHRELLDQYSPQLAAVPERWLHATVQGIHHSVPDGQLGRLADAARAELGQMEPFQVQIGPTWPGITAITVAIYPESGMADLNTRVRKAAQSVPGISLRPAESRFWAHGSLAYARDEFDDRRLNRALRALRPERVEVTVDRVHLVNQHQDVAAGYYTWDVVEEIPFGAPVGAPRQRAVGTAWT